MERDHCGAFAPQDLFNQLWKERLLIHLSNTIIKILGGFQRKFISKKSNTWFSLCWILMKKL